LLALVLAQLVEPVVLAADLIRRHSQMTILLLVLEIARLA
jgi:hypothetical protein